MIPMIVESKRLPYSTLLRYVVNPESSHFPVFIRHVVEISLRHQAQVHMHH